MQERVYDNYREAILTRVLAKVFTRVIEKKGNKMEQIIERT